MRQFGQNGGTRQSPCAAFGARTMQNKSARRAQRQRHRAVGQIQRKSGPRMPSASIAVPAALKHAVANQCSLKSWHRRAKRHRCGNAPMWKHRAPPHPLSQESHGPRRIGVRRPAVPSGHRAGLRIALRVTHRSANGRRVDALLRPVRLQASHRASGQPQVGRTASPIAAAGFRAANLLVTGLPVTGLRVVAHLVTDHQADRLADHVRRVRVERVGEG